MNSSIERKSAVGTLFLAGVCLLAFAFFAPDAAHRYDGSFVKLAAESKWRHPWEWSAAWCSLKIICLSVGLFLVFESVGTLLARIKRRNLALMVYLMEIFCVFGFLTGGYFFIKALF